MFSEASNFNQGVDTAFFVVFGISLFFLVAITITMIYFVVKYNRKKHPVAVQNPGNNLWRGLRKRAVRGYLRPGL